MAGTKDLLLLATACTASQITFTQMLQQQMNSLLGQ